jgi:hypothetical protein
MIEVAAIFAWTSIGCLSCGGLILGNFFPKGGSIIFAVCNVCQCICVIYWMIVAYRAVRFMLNENEKYGLELERYKMLNGCSDEYTQIDY